MKPFKTPASWLAPIRAAHLVQLDFYDGQRNFIHIWLPEGWFPQKGEDEFLRSPATRLGSAMCCVLDRTEDRRFFEEEGTLVTTFEDSRVRMRGEVSPIEDGVALSLSLTNLSDTPIGPSLANVCVQFAAAPSFADPLLERYFYVSGGTIVHVNRPYYNFEENHTWFFGTAPDTRFPHNPPADYGFVGLASKDGEWVAGHGWDSSKKVWGNCHPSLACFHSDPEFGKVNPGQTLVSKGVLYIMRGSPEECSARYDREFRRKA
jgi:hypothetical protein